MAELINRACGSNMRGVLGYGMLSWGRTVCGRGGEEKRGEERRMWGSKRGSEVRRMDEEGGLDVSGEAAWGGRVRKVMI